MPGGGDAILRRASRPATWKPLLFFHCLEETAKATILFRQRPHSQSVRNRLFNLIALLSRFQHGGCDMIQPKLHDIPQRSTCQLHRFTRKALR